MASPAQVAANQANARCSTGPRTAGGNSTDHGLCSKDYGRDAIQPAGAIELNLYVHRAERTYHKTPKEPQALQTIRPSIEIMAPGETIIDSLPPCRLSSSLSISTANAPPEAPASRRQAVRLLFDNSNPIFRSVHP